MSFIAKTISSNSGVKSIDCRSTAYPDSYDRPDPQFFVQSEVDNCINQLMTTGSCPDLCGDATGAPMSYEEAYDTVIEILTIEAELSA